MEEAFWCIKDLCISWKREKTKLHNFYKMFLLLRYLIEIIQNSQHVLELGLAKENLFL